MKEYLEQASSFVKDRWHRPVGLFAACAIAFALLVFYFAGIDIKQVSAVEWAIVSIVIIGLIVVWRKFRLPHVPKDKVGFGIAIKFEDSEQENKLRADFLIPLRQLLTSSNSAYSQRINCIELPQSIASELVEDDEKARRVAKEANLAFILFGRARVRTVEGASRYVVDLRAGVRHRQLQESVQRNFLSEFSEALPRRFVFRLDETIFECEFAAKHVDAYVRYIFATAAAFSHEFGFAENLLMEAERRLELISQQEEGNQTPTAVLLRKVQTRLAEIYEAWLDILMWRHNHLRDAGVLGEA
ncbi:MAG: hypothetical protein EXQ56_02490 [Acidobacteria bacterium]|nr:hypothetical protein [Acidobacteriota bacterium]